MKNIKSPNRCLKENMENTLMKRAPQRLIIGKLISQYASYSALFCPLHSNIGKSSIKSIATIHPAFTENMENIIVECALLISIRESHNVSISEMLNSNSKQGITQEVPHRFLCLIDLYVSYRSHSVSTANRHLTR